MAVKWSEGFDYLPELASNSATMANIWGALGFYGWFSFGAVPSTPQVLSLNPQWGYGKFVRIESNEYFAYVLDEPEAEGYLSCGVRTLPGTGAERGGYIRLINPILGTVLANIEIADYGVIKVFSGSGTGTPLGTSAAGVYPEHIWFQLEIHFKSGTGDGVLEVRVNGTTVVSMIDISLLDGVGAIGFYPQGDTGYDLDNLVLDDAAWPGMVRCQWLPPASAGDSTEWTPWDGTTPNWQAANNNLLDDQKYVYNDSDEPGDFDLYDVAPLVNTPEILAVTVKGAYRQSDATQQYVQNVIKSGATVLDGAVTPANPTYRFVKDVFNVDPNTGIGWTYPAVNTLQIGPKQQD